MRLDRHIVKSRIIDISSNTFDAAIDELIAVCPSKALDKIDLQKLRKQILDREKTMTTCLGNGVALPHIRLPINRPYIFALGRCPEGLEYNATEEYGKLRLVFLLLASDKNKGYLNILAAIARLFQDSGLVERLSGIQSIQALREEVMQVFGGVITRKASGGGRFNRLILKETEKIANGAKCSAIMIFGDTFVGGVELPQSLAYYKTILVTQTTADLAQNGGIVDDVITVRSFSNNRLSQLRSAVLIGITRGIIKYNERLCCVGGMSNSNQFDTLVVIDVEREFQTIFTKEKNILPESIKPEVLERVLAIAMELSVEGREGKPVGSLFVVGDIKKLAPYIKPLVLNPFYGYKEEDRNLLNPFMGETVKEFSSIDGAFIIRGDGVLEAAGSLIHAPGYHQELPSGLGTRHAAAAAISLAIDCIAITVSSSTGQITLFRQGQMLVINDKGLERNG